MSKKKGYIYILTNKSMPGLVKIGKTTRSPKTRAKELSGGTGVPTPFVVSHKRSVKDIHNAERDIHQALDEDRKNEKREFFEVDLRKAKRVTNRICNQYTSSSFIPTDFLSISDRVAYTILAMGLFVIDSFLILSVFSLKLGTPTNFNQISEEWMLSFGLVLTLTLMGLVLGRDGRRVVMVIGILLFTFIVSIAFHFI